jgi:threonine dehydrogenase-like Zn-dependent dehydrogenase
MQAVAVVPGVRESLRVRGDVPDPRPARGEALVRVLEAGVCGTDREIYEGVYGAAPPGSDFLVLGHENLGRVERPPASGDLRAGDLVVSTVRRPCPERCRPCREGQNDMCLTGNYTERGIKGRHGFMAETYAETADYLVTVPAALRPCAVLLEPMSVVEKGVDHAWHIQERLAWDPRVAVVVGAGTVGILAALALRLRGLEVTVVAQDAAGSFRGQHLAAAGIAYASTTATPLAELARERPVDLVFEATGSAAVVLPAIEMLGPGGVCILASLTAGERPVTVDAARFNRDLVLGNRLVFGTVNAGRRHFEAAARDLAAAESRWPGWAGRLITRRLPFTQAPQALGPAPDEIKTVLEFAS